MRPMMLVLVLAAAVAAAILIADGDPAAVIGRGAAAPEAPASSVAETGSGPTGEALVTLSYSEPPVPAGGGDAVRLLVLEGPGGAPLQGATVGWLDRSGLPPLRALFADASALAVEDRVARFGVQGVSGADGMVAFPRPAELAWACVRHGDRFAAIEVLAADAGPLRLILAPSIEHGITVVDPSGPVANCPLVIRGVLPGDRAGPIVWRGTSGADGRVLVRDLEPWVRARRGGGGEGGVGDIALEAVADVPGLPLARAALGPRGGVARVVLPSMGALEVDLPPGREPSIVRVHPKGMLPADVPSPIAVPVHFPALLPPGLRQREAQGGRVRFDFVPVGGDLVVERIDPRDDRVVVQEPARGPDAEGGVRVVALGEASAPRALRGRAVDGEGRVLAGATMEPSGALDSFRVRIVTGGDGRFHIPLPQGRAPVMEGVLVLSVGGTLEARVRTDGLPADGADLGDVAFAEVPIVVRGRVLDGAGSPVAGAHVLLPALPGLSEPRAAVTGDDGTFVLRAPQDALLSELHAYHRGYCAVGGDAVAVVPVERGAEVEVTLLRSGVLRGRVLVDAGVSPRDLEIVVSGTDAATHPAADGSFRLAGVPSGLRDLEVRLGLGEDAAVLARVAGVGVPGAAKGDEDPLDPIDLRGRLHGYRVRVEDVTGRALPDADVRFEGSGGRVAFAGHRGRDGTHAAVSDRAHLVVHVTAPGCTPHRGEVLPGDRVVVLSPLPAVTCLLAEGSVLSRDARPARLVLRPLLAGEGAESAARTLDGAWSVTVRAAPGRYRAELHVLGGDAPSSGPAEVVVLLLGQVEVSPAGRQVLRLPLTAQAWSSARTER